MQRTNGLIIATLLSFLPWSTYIVEALLPANKVIAFHTQPLLLLRFCDSSFLAMQDSTRTFLCASNEKRLAAASSKKPKRPLYSFSEARKIARGHGFGSLQEFLDYDCAGAYQLPKNADEVWAKDWTHWDDFLGVPLEFLEARGIARKHVGMASEYKVSTEAQYLDLHKRKVFEDGDIASRLPYRPDLKYKTKGWISWEDFLQEPGESNKAVGGK